MNYSAVKYALRYRPSNQWVSPYLEYNDELERYELFPDFCDELTDCTLYSSSENLKQDLSHCLQQNKELDQDLNNYQLVEVKIEANYDP